MFDPHCLLPNFGLSLVLKSLVEKTCTAKSGARRYNLIQVCEKVIKQVRVICIGGRSSSPWAQAAHHCWLPLSHSLLLEILCPLHCSLGGKKDQVVILNACRFQLRIVIPKKPAIMQEYLIVNIDTFFSANENFNVFNFSLVV